jgi:hypothetical protein
MFDEYLERNIYVNFAEELYNSVHINCDGYSQKMVYMNCGTDLYYNTDIKHGRIYS